MRAIHKYHIPPLSHRPLYTLLWWEAEILPDLLFLVVFDLAWGSAHLSAAVAHRNFSFSCIVYTELRLFGSTAQHSWAAHTFLRRLGLGHWLLILGATESWSHILSCSKLQEERRR